MELNRLRLRVQAVKDVLFEYTYYTDGERIVDPLESNETALRLREKVWAALQAEPGCDHEVKPKAVTAPYDPAYGQNCRGCSE